VFVSFLGFEIIATVAGEIKNPSRTIPLSMILSVVSVTILYVLVMLVSTGVVPIDVLGESPIPVSDVAAVSMGTIGVVAIAFAAIIAAISSSNSSILAASRVIYAMGRDGLMSDWFNESHDRFYTPHRAILATGGVTALLIALGLGVETIIAEGIIDAPVSSVLRRERRHTRCLARDKTGSPLMVWLSNRLQVAGTLVVSNAAVAAISAKERGLERGDLVSIQGEFSKGDVLHAYDENGNEFARGLTNFSSEETILMARNPDMKVEDVIGYKTKSDIIGSENILILEGHHLQLEAPEDDGQRVISI
jgi:hypothetical protein